MGAIDTIKRYTLAHLVSYKQTNLGSVLLIKCNQIIDPTAMRLASELKRNDTDKTFYESDPNTVLQE